MKVLVTGGNGRAGRWVVRDLAAAGHDVVNVDLAPAPALELPGEFCQVDLTDAGQVYDVLAQYRPDGVAHLAANPSPSGHARVSVFDNHVVSAHNLLQAGRGLGTGASLL